MSGVPCVASDVGDVRVALDGAGLVVPPEDPAALASALGELAGRPRSGVSSAPRHTSGRASGTASRR